MCCVTYIYIESNANCVEGKVNGKRMREVGLVVPAEYTAICKDFRTEKKLYSELREKKMEKNTSI